MLSIRHMSRHAAHWLKQGTRQLGDRLVVKAIILAFILSLCASFWLKHQLFAAGPLQQDIRLIIPKGTGVNKIGRMLQEQGVLHHPRFFAFVSFIREGSLQAGEYIFPAHISLHDTVEKLQSGDVVMHRLTIPEGLTTGQIKALLENTPLLSGYITHPVEEGSLFPDTYFYRYSDSRDGILRRMQERKQQIFQVLWANRNVNLRLNKKQVVILASIVEKETGLESERKRVAAVFLNRLRKNMRLQSDPTVIYAITEGKGTLNRPLTRSDLSFDSPYNTYVNKGLPPAPICNPGKASLEAVLLSADTNDLYFVADGNGGHVFAETLQEHNKNVARYRRFQRVQDTTPTPKPVNR